MRASMVGRVAARVCALLLLATAAAAFMAEAHAESATRSQGAQAHIDFRILIPVVVRARALTAPRYLPIGEADVARGYVDVDGATSLVLTSNSPVGYAVSVAFDKRLVSRVEVRIQGNTLEASSQESWLHVDAPRMLDAPVRVAYRLYLAAGAHAGTYRWPVALGFAAGA